MSFTAYTTAPSGAAGGGLTGSYPNPGISSAAVIGATNWEWLPSDNSMLIANGDPWDSGLSGLALTAGTVYLMKLYIRAAITATNILLGNQTPGSGASTGSFVGLYSSAGSLLSGSADQGTSFVAAAGLISCPLTTPQALAAGTFVWAAVVSNLATTQIALFRATANSAFANGLQTAANYRFAINGTSQTSLPASITPSSNAQGSTYWAGIS